MMPVADSVATPSSPIGGGTETPAADLHRILIVDDEEDVCVFLRDLLSEQGWESVACGTPAEAFELAVGGGVDGILLDVMLPGEDGYALCRRLREDERTRGLPVVMISAKQEERDAVEAFLSGADDFVSKPFRAAELVARMRAALASRSSHERLRAAERDQKVVLALTQRMAASYDPVDILFEVATCARDLLGVGRAAVVLLDESGRGRIVAAAEDASVTDLPIDLESYPEIAEVVRRREPLLIPEAAADPILDAVRERVVRAGVRSQILFPIEAAGRVMGVLFLRNHDRPIKAGEREMGLGRQLASSLAMALRNALLFQEVRADATRLDEARHVAEGRVLELIRFEGFFEGASDGLLISDAERRVMYINREGERVARLARGEAIGKHVEDLMAPESRGDAISVCNRAIAGERRVLADFTIAGRREGEQPLVVQVAANRVGDGGSEVLLAFRDVTADRATAQELRRTKEFLQNLIDSCADAIIASEMRGRIVLFNQGAERLFGFSAVEAIASLSVRELYPEGGAREVMRLLRSEAHGGVGRLQSTRFLARHASGTEIPIAISAALLHEGDKEIGTVGFVVDLSERERIEKKLAATQAELRRSEQQGVLAELAGATAHELNQPLTSVVGLTELLLKRTPDDAEFDRQRRNLSTLLDESARMADIVRKIGRITRYQTKQYVGDTRIVDLDASTATHDSDAGEKG